MGSGKGQSRRVHSKQVFAPYNSSYWKAFLSSQKLERKSLGEYYLDPARPSRGERAWQRQETPVLARNLLHDLTTIRTIVLPQGAVVEDYDFFIRDQTQAGISTSTPRLFLVNKRNGKETRLPVFPEFINARTPMGDHVIGSFINTVSYAIIDLEVA